MVIWLTGLSGAGKTALSDALIAAVKPRLPTLVRLDGDVIRAIFGAGLGYSEPERVVQIKRIQALAKELDQQGFVVLVAALYAHPDLLAWNRANFSDYFEVYLNTSLEEVQRRDAKGLYRRAKKTASSATSSASTSLGMRPRTPISRSTAPPILPPALPTA
jgi:adenylylsulfate kinase